MLGAVIQQNQAEAQVERLAQLPAAVAKAWVNAPLRMSPWAPSSTKP